MALGKIARVNFSHVDEQDQDNRIGTALKDKTGAYFCVLKGSDVGTGMALSLALYFNGTVKSVSACVCV